MEKEPPMPAASMPMMFDRDKAASRLRDHSASATPSADRTAEKRLFAFKGVGVVGGVGRVVVV